MRGYRRFCSGKDLLSAEKRRCVIAMLVLPYW